MKSLRTCCYHSSIFTCQPTTQLECGEVWEEEEQKEEEKAGAHCCSSH